MTYSTFAVSRANHGPRRLPTSTIHSAHPTNTQVAPRLAALTFNQLASRIRLSYPARNAYRSKPQCNPPGDKAPSSTKETLQETLQLRPAQSAKCCRPRRSGQRFNPTNLVLHAPGRGRALHSSRTEE